MKILQKKQQKPARRAATRTERSSSSDLAARYTFRRNRTLTGSLASEVSSVGEHGAELKSSRVRGHELRRHRRRLSGVFIGILLVAGALFFVIYQSIAIPRVYASTDSPVDALYYETIIQNYLNERPLERSRVTLNTTRLSQYMQVNGAPEVVGVMDDMWFDGIGVTVITLDFRQPAVVWNTEDTYVYVDEQGVSFTRNYYTQPDVRVVDQTGIVAEKNQVLASSRFLAFIGQTVGRMKENGFTVAQVALPINTSRQLAVSLKGVPYPIKFSVDRPVGEQAEDAARAVRYLDSQGNIPEYLDVRVSGKAFYK
ncbi:hypothetical protein EOL96_03380 [Candidatus Saccharibacteria bacterium]|nr:hypothetical protein [Candidatus Saccharibacteria bacterium]